MRGSEREGEQHSTDPRPRPWGRVIASLAVFGFLIGLMIGRMLQPEPLWLERVEVQEDGLALWFNVEPRAAVRSMLLAVCCYRAPGELWPRAARASCGCRDGWPIGDCSASARICCCGWWRPGRCAASGAQRKLDGLLAAGGQPGGAIKEGNAPACLYQGPRNWDCLSLCRLCASFVTVAEMSP